MEVALLVMERASGELGVVVGWWVVFKGRFTRAVVVR